MHGTRETIRTRLAESQRTERAERRLRPPEFQESQRAERTRLRLPELAQHKLLDTERDGLQTVLRLSLAAVLFPHGAQHFLGWFGGYGFGGTLGWMVGELGFPTVLAALAIVTEFFGPIGLVLGLGGRLAALGIVGLMVGAASTHWQHGFFMNWFGALPAGAEGFEYHLLVIVLAVAVVWKGSGAWSIDRALLPVNAVERR